MKCYIFVRYIWYPSPGEMKHTHKSESVSGGLSTGRAGVVDGTNKRVRSERKEAQSVCCRVQVDDVHLILEVERCMC